jgi:hypothetical protein
LRYVSLSFIVKALTTLSFVGGDDSVGGTVPSVATTPPAEAAAAAACG